MGKFLLATVVILLCFWRSHCDFPENNWYQPSLNYQPYRTRAMYRVVPESKEEMESLLHLVAHPDVVVWSKISHAGQPVDILIPRNQVADILEWLQAQNMSPKLVDKRVTINFSTNYDTTANYARMFSPTPATSIAGRTSQQAPRLRNKYCPQGQLDESTCRSTPCITYFDQAESTCERWIGAGYSFKSDTKDSCFMGLLHITTCCQCKV